MKQDIKKLQEYNTAAKTDLEKYERQVHMMHDELQNQTERNKQSIEELAVKVFTVAQRVSVHSSYTDCILLV